MVRTTFVSFHPTTGSKTSALFQAITWRTSNLPRTIDSVAGLPFFFATFMANKWCITAKSCRLVSSSKSNATSAVISQIKPAFGCGHHEGCMSSHIVAELVFKGPSHEPHSKPTAPSAREPRVQPLVPPK